MSTITAPSLASLPMIPAVLRSSTQHAAIVDPVPDELISVLAEQHAEIDRLIVRLFRTTDGRTHAFLELAARLAAHVAVETQIFYPAVMRECELRRDLIGESTTLKRHVADMLGLNADGGDAEEFDLKLGQLADLVDAHAHRFEDEVLFPVLADIMDDAEREALGEAAKRMYAQLLRHDDASDDLQRAA